jgi:hypothetical protein
MMMMMMMMMMVMMCVSRLVGLAGSVGLT